MDITWHLKDSSNNIYVGETKSKFYANITMSTNQGKYMWIILHENSGYAQWGSEESDVEHAKSAVLDWLAVNCESWVVTNPRNV